MEQNQDATTMKAYVTSIGEKTTDLCVWALERNGFDVQVYGNPKQTLQEKLVLTYQNASFVGHDFLRVDADVIVNQQCTPETIREWCNDKSEEWWVQFQCFDWFQQNIGFGGIQFIKKQALPALLKNVDRFVDAERPETELSRIDEFYKPRRFGSAPVVLGLNNYRNDIIRVKQTKERRGQEGYDWSLVARLEKL